MHRGQCIGQVQYSSKVDHGTIWTVKEQWTILFSYMIWYKVLKDVSVCIFNTNPQLFELSLGVDLSQFPKLINLRGGNISN